MPAAMTVSLLVGTFRTLAHYSQNPAEILTAMNQRMLARSKDGFTTCMVLRIDRGGSATLANAGHLATYLGAHEFAIDTGLPLGLAEESVYQESSFFLDTGQELTLLTDGVAEARGQQDDITVLKIRRCPVPVPAGVPLAAAPSTSADSALVEGLSASG
jgi:serine phosphatase RsbU (regulator of sigma subunit)